MIVRSSQLSLNSLSSTTRICGPAGVIAVMQPVDTTNAATRALKVRRRFNWRLLPRVIIGTQQGRSQVPQGNEKIAG